MIRSFYSQRQNLSEISVYAAAFVSSLLLHGLVLQHLSHEQPSPLRHPIMIDAAVTLMPAGSGGAGGLPAGSIAPGNSAADGDEIETLSGPTKSAPEAASAAQPESRPEPVPSSRQRAAADQWRQLQRTLRQQDLSDRNIRAWGSGRSGAGGNGTGGGGTQDGPYIPGVPGGSVIGNYIVMIAGKIQKNVNRDLCRRARPEIIFAIRLRADGQLQAPPQLLKSSGLAVCDDAIERAILQSLPLPVPHDPAAFAALHELHLLFRPYDENFGNPVLQ